VSADAAAVHYGLEPDLTPAEFIDLLMRSTLGERRPVQDVDRIGHMLAGADLIVTARIEEGLLVGVSRALSDFAWCTYLADLAVDAAYQRRGIGQELVRRTHEAAGRGTMLLLLAAPAAREYYPKIGMSRHDSCWTLPRRERNG
jgi:GNAT superfamily N-acetyltransferase